jgi:Tfp pilus assembly protein PilZ
MKKRPLVIWLVGLGLIVSPLYYYFEKSFLARIPWTQAAAIVSAMSIAKLIGIVLGPIVGALLLRMRPISWYAIIGYAIYTIGANVALVATHHMRAWVFAVNVPTALVVILYFVRREVMSPYFNPRLRWWESDRVALKAKAEVTLDDGRTIDAETLDISPTGVFLVTDETIAAGQAMDVTIAIGKEATKARARAVWTSDGARRPAGVGARFDERSSRTIEAALARIAPRAAPRHSFTLEVDLVRGGGAKETFSCKTFDISEGGCFLVTDRTFDVGERIDLTLHMLDEPVTVRGEIVWRSDGEQAPPGIGVRFTRRSRLLGEQLRNLHGGKGAPAKSVPPAGMESAGKVVEGELEHGAKQLHK